ncbi:hypothetical protein [Solirubrum puertoriconensis]|uniref:YARHG domain-containing protein n=1 Tax=Solirubrum puertoriconensis TaxID=1751427 RepID=A0A9X0HJG4_SOLP1|nr:hypothetical protein [Solirubrum puertoriconensis]KUG06986.1 hypothetical protein ASU33_06605 [Solirubrum puertoriconensis]
MKKPLLASCTLLTLQLCSNWVFGQTAVAPPDTTLLTSAMEHMHLRYRETVGSSAALYSGQQYVNYASGTAQGHQFFKSKNDLPGSVFYDGYEFTGLAMQYDAKQDALLVNSYNSPAKFRLVDERVEHFVIDGHRFVRIVADSAAADVVTTGFYELLYEGGPQLRVLAKHSKNLQIRMGQRMSYQEFIDIDRYYLQKGNRYYPVSKKGSVLALFSDRKKELKKYAAEQKLRFSKEKRAEAIVQLAKYYHGLTQAAAR